MSCEELPYEAFCNKLNEFCRHLCQRTVAFVWLNEDGSPWHGGTGVLLQIDDAFLILTAAHVFDDLGTEVNKRGPLLVAGGMQDEVPISFDGNLWATHTQKQERYGDLVDLAMIKLADSMVQRLLVKNRFLTLSDLEIVPTRSPDHRFCVVGWPKGSRTIDNERSLYTSEPFCYLGSSTTPDPEKVLVYDEQINLAISIDQKARTGPRGELMDVPDLQGISGCGIWRIAHRSNPFIEWTVNDSKLVGIEHAVPGGGASVLVGTQIKWWLPWIAEKLPHLRPVVCGWLNEIAQASTNA